jgi:hypothetical protein
MSRPPARPSRLAELFGVDLRSLALVRIGVGTLLLADLALRSRDFRAHYTDFGILPREAIAGHGWVALYTLHAAASPSALAVGALFALVADYVQERTTPRGRRREGIPTLLAQECDPVPPPAAGPEEGADRE